jgi:hypothetical protein
MKPKTLAIGFLSRTVPAFGGLVGGVPVED